MLEIITTKNEEESFIIFKLEPNTNKKLYAFYLDQGVTKQFGWFEKSKAKEQNLKIVRIYKSQINEKFKAFFKGSFLQKESNLRKLEGLTFTNYKSFHDSVLLFLKAGDYVPIIFTLKYDMLIDGLMTKSASAMLLSCMFYEDNSKIYLKSKANSSYRYDLSRIPYDLIVGIKYHHEFIVDPLAFGKYKKLQDLEVDVLKFVRKNIRTTLVFEFGCSVFLQGYSMEPVTSMKIECSLLTLSNDNRRTWRDVIVLYVKPGANSFFYLDYLPFQSCVAVSFFADYEEPYLIKKDKKTIKITKDETPIPDSISLYQILLNSRYSNNIREDNSCIVCGRLLKSESPLYIRLLTSGALSNIPKDELSDHFGYFLVGPECRKYIPDEYVFTAHQAGIKPQLEDEMQSF